MTSKMFILTKEAYFDKNGWYWERKAYQKDPYYHPRARTFSFM